MARIEIEGAGSYECAEGDTLLRSALRSGLGFPYSCNTGACGTCRFQLVEGDVEHLRRDPPAWSERDRARSRWLGCQARALEDCRIKVRLEDQGPVIAPTIRPAELVESLEVTHDMREFHFSIEGSDSFLPGQYALLDLAGVEGPRPYSMSNLAGSGEWHFLIKLVPGGAATSVLFEDLAPGDEVGLDGPYGLAYLRENGDRDLLMVAGGSGLSPLLSIAKAAAMSQPDRRIHFFYGGRSPQDLCAEPLLREVDGLGVDLTVISAVSDKADDWDGPSGFIHEVVDARMGGRLDEVDVYFAGPPPMTAAMQLMLHEAGVEPERVHFDEFF